MCGQAVGYRADKVSVNSAALRNQDLSTVLLHAGLPGVCRSRDAPVLTMLKMAEWSVISTVAVNRQTALFRMGA